MFRSVTLGALLGLMIFSVACSKGCKKEEEQPAAAAPEAAAPAPEGAPEAAPPQSNVTAEDREKGNVVSGDSITKDYAAVLCGKYGDCKVEGAPVGPDCANTITTALSQSPDWKNNEFKKDKMDQCLKDLKGLSCDDFKAQKVPQSCQES